MKKTTQIINIILLGCILILTGIWIYFQKTLEQIDMEKTGKSATYQKHYVLIADEKDSMLWQSVYESAREKAADADAYLELIHLGDNEENTLEDCLQICIASRVDGIILRPDGSEGVRKLIGQSVENGIPVVTILEDDSQSGRTSFVGINGYQMGEVYAEQVLKYLRSDYTGIMLLADTDSVNSGVNLIYSQMLKVIEQEKQPGQTVDITVYPVDSSIDFETEEVIRDIFVNKELLPDIMICMDEVATECSYQALVDYNEVGNVDIIGFYYSDLILDAVGKGTIPVTIALDTEEISEYSIGALEEYLSMKHASDYYSVEMSVITSENVDLFIESEQEEQ